MVAKVILQCASLCCFEQNVIKQTYPFRRNTEKPNLVNFRSAKEIVFILQKVLQMAFQNISSIDWTIYELLWAIECTGQLFSA